jgi:hypothetical protein
LVSEVGRIRAKWATLIDELAMSGSHQRN